MSGTAIALLGLYLIGLCAWFPRIFSWRRTARVWKGAPRGWWVEVDGEPYVMWLGLVYAITWPVSIPLGLLLMAWAWRR